jgi:hypothetical protein
VSQSQPIISQEPKKPWALVPVVRPTIAFTTLPKSAYQEIKHMEYNVVEYFKNIKENILVMDLCKISQ